MQEGGVSYFSAKQEPASFCVEAFSLQEKASFEPPNLLKDWIAQPSLFVRSEFASWGCQTFLQEGMTLSPAPLTRLGYSCISLFPGFL
jgi:hypothetical protein